MYYGIFRIHKIFLLSKLFVSLREKFYSLELILSSRRVTELKMANRTFENHMAFSNIVDSLKVM